MMLKCFKLDMKKLVGTSWNFNKDQNFCRQFLSTQPIRYDTQNYGCQFDCGAAVECEEKVWNSCDGELSKFIIKICLDSCMDQENVW